MKKSYVKMIEEENYELRQRVEQIDSELCNVRSDYEKEFTKVMITMHFSFTDGIEEYMNSNESIYREDDENYAICDISTGMINYFSNCEPVWKSWRVEKIRKLVGEKLKPKWSLHYWHLGMRFQKIDFVMDRKKRYFINVNVNSHESNRNFQYIDERDLVGLRRFIGRTPVFYKKELYRVINDNDYKRMFTPYK